jgi:hypothetical protein
MQVYERVATVSSSVLSRSSASNWRRRKDNYLLRYTTFFCLCFFLYAVLGKGFAYAGVAPVFVGELLLVTGVVVAIRTGKVTYLAETPIGLLLIVFCLWQSVCTLPYLGVYRMDTLRDAVLWVYSAFAWIVAAVVLRSEKSIGLVLERFGRYGGILLTLAFASFLATSFLSSILPTWPGTDISIPLVKPGDMLVHVAGVVSFLLVGLVVRKAWWVAAALGAFVIGATAGRGGGVACALAIALAFVFFPRINKAVPVIAALLLMLLVVSALDIRIRFPKSQREFSAEQLTGNVASVFGQKEQASNAEPLEETKRWRLEWWNRIIAYTFNGPYFWTGKGYGVNLTVSDGMARSDKTFPGLRDPHNSHLAFLARSGVPGFSLWVILQVGWAVSLLRAYFLARRQGRVLWARIFVWLIAYWLAFIVNASFDVSFEGPTAGIPFWIIFGFGWGARLRFERTMKINDPLFGADVRPTKVPFSTQRKSVSAYS